MLKTAMSSATAPSSAKTSTDTKGKAKATKTQMASSSTSSTSSSSSSSQPPALSLTTDTVQYMPRSAMNKSQSTRPKKKATVVPVTKFSLDKDVQIAKLNNGKFKVMRLTSPSGGPVLIELRGGGRIPPTFGLEVNTFKDDAMERTLTVDIQDEAEQKALQDISRSLGDLAIKRRSEWFPNSTVSDGTLRELHNALVTAPRPREGGGHWPGLLKLGFNERDCASSDNRVARVRIELGDDKERVEDIQTILGCRWSRIVIELPCIFLGSKSCYGFSKKLRVLRIEESDEYEIAESEEDDEVNEPASKRSKREQWVVL